MTCFLGFETTTNGQRKLFHWFTTWKITSVAMTGPHKGRMIFKKIYHSPAPSMDADSLRESGILSINCLARKIPYAHAKEPKISGHHVSSIFQSRYCKKRGIIRTSNGIIMTARTMRNRIPLQGNFPLEKA